MLDPGRGTSPPADSLALVSKAPPDSRTADETGMRTGHSATALAACTAGLTAPTTLRRLAGPRLPMTAAVTTTALPSIAPVPDYDAVVLPLARTVVAGAPCGARTTT